VIGKTISHYKITEKLGEGGMGEVYLAEDLKLQRKVAIKFLPHHLTSNKENVERFEREARAAASLNHPNIVTIHEVNKFESQIFIVMEYVEGNTLRKLLNTPLYPPLSGGKLAPSPIPRSQFPISDTLTIISQIAEGLSKAHQAGIIHRDIKPENILIDNDGRVKILDFGLAKLMGVSKLTKESTALGTVHYMSPEQILGQEADNRSDIWSLGILFYEMLTGELPFKGEYEQAVLYAVLHEEPKMLNEIESVSSPGVSAVISKMIIKERDKRYQHCTDIITDLNTKIDSKFKSKKSGSKRFYSVAGIFTFTILILLSILYFLVQKNAETSLKALAVLPFDNSTNDTEIDFLAFSIADEITGDLLYIPDISVRPSSSIRKYEKGIVDPLIAGKELKVDYILTGNYLKETDTIRVNVELINVRENQILRRWKVEREYHNKLKLIDDISEEVIDELQLELTVDERNRIIKSIPVDPLAYEYYLRAVSRSSSIEDNQISIELLKKSIEIDSSFAPSFAELGYRIRMKTQTVIKSEREVVNAEKFFLKALSLDDELLSALNYLSKLYTDFGHTDKAMNLLNRALNINPNNALTHYVLSYLYRFTGMLHESADQARLALQLDPINQRFRSVIWTFIYLGEYEKALGYSEIDKGSIFEYIIKGVIYFRKGQSDSALAYFDHVIQIQQKGYLPTYSAICKLYLEDKLEEGKQLLRQWEQADPYDGETLYWLASLYACYGDIDGCIRVLQKSIIRGFFNYPLMLQDYFLDSVRNDPKFQTVLALAKEKHEIFKNKYFPG
jgi:serine/threonine protein kinase/Tfp pilus assembly protein PilF